MKKQTKLTSRFSFALIFVLLLCKPALAQPPYWKLNGNPNAGPDIVTTANNFFGTNGINNTAVRLGTFGITRMFIQNNIGPTAGFVGIGNGFMAPASMLHLNDGIGSTFQMTDLGTGPLAGDGFRILQVGTQIRLGQQELDNMFFHTGGTIAAANERMIIIGGGGATQGFVGIGTNFVSPLSLLNVSAYNNATGKVFRTDGLQTLTNEWEMFTGPNAGGTALRGRIFAPFNPPLADFNMEATVGSIRLFAAGGFGTVNNILERMVVTNGDYLDAASALISSDVTRVGISYGSGVGAIVAPVSMLHIGFDANAGFRNWMDIGTFMAKGDNMYVGLKDEGTNRQDAVINWGDDGVAAGPDNLRFIFTGVSGPPAALAFDGFETGRVSPLGFWGIGNFFNDPLFPFGNPVRKMEILSDKAIAAANGNPQLRLTNFQQDPANVATTGRYAEFHDLQNGDLNISANDNTQINTITQILKERFVGINTTTPGNTVEINSQYVSSATPNGQPAIPPTLVPPTGWAGLRFSDLRSTSEPQANPSASVLSVNGSGDVILVHGTVVGNYCFTTQNPLTGADYEIPLNNKNYRFTGKGIPFDPATSINTNTVGVGYDCSNPMPAKFSVFEANSIAITAGVNTVASSFINSDFAAGASATFVAVRGLTNGAQPIGNITNIGGQFTGQNAPVNYGVRGIAISAGPLGAAINYGVYGRAANGGTGNYAGYFDGDLFVNGPTSGLGTIFASDSIFKTNVDTISNALNIIKQLKPKQYFLDTANTNGFNFPSQKQYGLIAQQVATVLPELVLLSTKPAEYDTLGVVVYPAITYKSLNYNAFIAILMKGIQEQQKMVDSLKDENNVQDSINTSLQSQIAALATLINSCCSSHSMQSNGEIQSQSIAQTNVDLKDGQSIVLDQNSPNPFSEQTTINYFLPDNVVKAQMLFYNAQGKLIQSVDLNEKGKGSLNVFAQDLSNGIYTYTLVVDGKIFETKKMVKQK